MLFRCVSNHNGITFRFTKKNRNMDFKKIILITGGAGFIGSHVVRRFVNKYPRYLVVNLDALTYAGNLDNLRDIEDKPNYVFEKGDIVDAERMNELFNKYLFTGVIHLAAESHVDRSISDPMSFINTNIIGTVNLLNAARAIWTKNGDIPATEGYRFHHVSTDEVFGSLGDEGFFTESTSYDPRSPYSASKASSDHLVSAYHHTYHLPTVMSNCSNNYGPNHFPEKLIPLIINNILTNKALPIYGDGKYTRDWLWVKDHASAIDTIFHDGRVGESYNIGGNNEWKNIDLVHKLCDIMDEKLARPAGTARQLITFVRDRPGHDRRYAIDASKLKDELGWTPSISFDEGFKETIEWYLTNKEWVERVTSGAYQAYYTEQYA
jgi:dTDP-glucose 4,6-dehydratase